MALELEIQDRDGATHKFPLEGEKLRLGRSHDNDISFPQDASLSRHHLMLEHDTQGWWIRDLESKNGTLINGVRVVGRRSIAAGDQIAAGHLAIGVVDPSLPASGSVEFFPGESSSADTMMTSLRGVLSGESPVIGDAQDTAPAPSRLLAHPAVSALMKAGRQLAVHRPLEELFEHILSLAIEAVRAERGLLMVLEDGELVVRALHGEGFRISSAVRDHVLNEKASVLVRDTDLDEAFKASHTISEQQIRTMMAVPLQTEERVIGLVYVDSRNLAKEFSADDLELLTVLANHAAIRIEHERLAEVERKEQLISRDLEQAAMIQMGLLPTVAPTIAGVELSGHHAACRTVGGDYFDFFAYPDGRVAVVLGDVSGKGMPAAMLMSSLQAQVQLLAQEPDDPGKLMSRLDLAVSRTCPTNRFISLFFGILDPASGEMHYCNAGHNPPLLIRRAGGVEELGSNGTVLGILPELPYEERICTLEAGDLFAVFSDGVTEAANHAEEEFGEKRLAATLREVGNQSLDDMVETIFETIAEWCAGAPQADDITLLLARRTG